MIELKPILKQLKDLDYDAWNILIQFSTINNLEASLVYSMAQSAIETINEANLVSNDDKEGPYMQ